MAHRIITISRQHGSWGDEVAALTAKKLGIKCYDKQLLDAALEYGDLNTSKHADRFRQSDEKKPNLAFYKLYDEGNKNVKNQLPIEDTVFELQQQIIKNIAQEEDAIIVGRCANWSLREEDVRLLTVFVTSPLETRVERVMEEKSLGRAQAKHYVKTKDRQRGEYYYYFTKEHWNGNDGYQLVLNSDTLGIEGCADVLCGAFEKL